MCASKNTESMAHQGEFHARKPPSEPLTHHGHAPGVHVGHNASPEFHAETYSPGTAPSESSFRPNNISEIPGQALNPDSELSGTRTAASATIAGATSADVDRGMGHPGGGMTSSEMHHRHGKGKKERSGLAGVGADHADPVRERRLDVDVEPGERGKENPENVRYAEDRYPMTAEEVSTERQHEFKHERRHERQHERRS